jgi:hypothetical protein
MQNPILLYMLLNLFFLDQILPGLVVYATMSMDIFCGTEIHR